MTEPATDPDPYEQFVERYFETGEKAISESWPAELRARCRFFLRMAEDSRGFAAAATPAPAPSCAPVSAPASPEPIAASSPSLSPERSVLEETGMDAGVELVGPGREAEASALGRARARGRQGERYVVEREIARGGMGRILLAYDRDFRRRIAVKVLLAPRTDKRTSGRFIEEAQATAQLEHPNIAPVYDLGVDVQGAPFFTMKWIRGRDLKQVISAEAARPSLVRLIQILQQAAMGVHFANSRGVIHRDLKPQNIMVGDYGEVLVVDWGLAKILHGGTAEAADRRDAGDASDASDAGDAGDRIEPGGGESKEKEEVTTDRADSGQKTFEGTVQGSPAYMTPEQARGEVGEIDARTDVFGLGAILYEVLTGSPPFEGTSFRMVLEKARRGLVTPPRERAPDRAIPPALDAVCRRALSARKEDRHASARELHDELQSYIEGIHDAERRAAEASRLQTAANGILTDLRAAEREEARLATEEGVLRRRLQEHAPEEERKALWDLQARLAAARAEAGAAFNRTTSAYQAVLAIEPSHAPAREALAAIYLERMIMAEARGDAESAALYEGLVAQHHGGRFSAELEGQALLRLRTEPAGARISIARYREAGPLLVLPAAEALGQAPLERALPRGSYMLLVERAGHESLRCPLLLERSATVEVSLRLEAVGSIAPGFLQVCAGDSIVGSSGRDQPSLQRARQRVETFFVGEYPVSFGEYCTFLDEKSDWDEGSLEASWPAFGREVYVERDADGRHRPLTRLDPRMPVFAVSFASAELYCRWLARSLGRDVSLLEEVEWERAARGADGRLYPWGNGFDWALMKGGRSRPGEPSPEPVGRFPRDTSPFGVREMAGGVREHVLGWYGEGYRVARGGSWFNPLPFIFRADSRSSLRDGSRATDVGFRVCYHGPSGSGG